MRPAGELSLASHFVEWAWQAAGSAERFEVAEARAEIYEARSKAETSLMAINLYRSAAAYAREGRPFA